MTRRILTSVVAAATMTIACGGSPQTGDEAAARAQPANTAAQPAGSAPAGPTAPSAAETPRADAAVPPDVLPDTASPLPLIGLGGLASLALAAGLRARRR